jgi:hypothetical protein
MEGSERMEDTFKDGTVRLLQNHLLTDQRQTQMK